MSSAKEIFTKFFESEQDEVRRVRRGKSSSEICVIAREAWDRLSIGDKTALNVFFNFCENRKDKTSMLGQEMWDYFLGHSAESLVSKPDVLVCLKLFLGESE
jgi:hypothetical protein